MEIKIVNKRTHSGPGHNIMRGTPLGNPFHMKSEADRNNVILKYREWLWHKIQLNDPVVMNELRKLLAIAMTGELVLICCCKPKQCHGDVIKSALIWLAGKKA